MATTFWRSSESGKNLVRITAPPSASEMERAPAKTGRTAAATAPNAMTNRMAVTGSTRRSARRASDALALRRS